LPLNINTLTFTFAYLAYIIGKYGLASNNIPTLVVFPVFILYQMYWSWMNGCNSLSYSTASMILGGGLGALFSYAVDQTGIVQLQYFNGISNQEVCVRATNAKYKCSTKPKV
jgi:lipoprotein signal peptidase